MQGWTIEKMKMMDGFVSDQLSVLRAIGRAIGYPVCLLHGHRWDTAAYFYGPRVGLNKMCQDCKACEVDGQVRMLPDGSEPN